MPESFPRPGRSYRDFPTTRQERERVGFSISSHHQPPQPRRVVCTTATEDFFIHYHRAVFVFFWLVLFCSLWFPLLWWWFVGARCVWCEENTPHVSPLCRQNGNVFVPIASLAKGNARMTHTRAFASSLSDFRNSPSCGQFSVRVCVVCLLFHKKSLSILSLLVSSTISISTQPKKKGEKNRNTPQR